MEIIKYAGKSCVKCKTLERIFSMVDLPCEVQTIYVEDVGEPAFVAAGVNMMPTVIIKNGEEKIKLEGMITPKQLQEAIEKVNG